MAQIIEKPISIFKAPLNLLNKYNLSAEISPFSGKWVSYMDPSWAIEDIKFKPTPTKAWLQKTVNWFIHEYNGTAPENCNFREKEIQLAKHLLKGKD
jgi:hypothetical protein